MPTVVLLNLLRTSYSAAIPLGNTLLTFSLARRLGGSGFVAGELGWHAVRNTRNPAPLLPVRSLRMA